MIRSSLAGSSGRQFNYGSSGSATLANLKPCFNQRYLMCRFLAQQMLMQELDKAADSVKEAKDSSRANTLLR